MHTSLPSLPLTTTTVVIQDLDDEDDSRPASNSKGKEVSVLLLLKKRFCPVCPPPATTSKALRRTLLKTSLSKVLSLSLSLFAPLRKARVRRHQLLTASRESRLCLLLLLLPLAYDIYPQDDNKKSAVPLSLDVSQAFTSTVLTHNLDHDNL